MGFNVQPSGATAQGTFVPDNLIAGDFDIITKSVTIISGQNLVRGAVLQVSGTPGKYNIVTTDANAKYILAEDCDASAGDKTAPVYVTGEFNATEVTIGGGATLAGVTAALEPLSIFLRTPVSN